MPPKEETPKIVENTWDRKGVYNRINAQNELKRKIAMESSRHVVVRGTQDPHRKLRERLSTYHNVRHMKTDYKNYVKTFGKPAFEVPDFNS